MRNFVAKYCRAFNKAKVERNRKKSLKNGYVKHKKCLTSAAA